MWFTVAQFLVVHAFRRPVISSSFQFAQFGMVMTLIRRCRLRKIRWLRCFDMVVERAWSCPPQVWCQTITTSEIAQVGRVTETRHIESAICAVQAFRLSGWQLCRCGQQSHTGTVLRQVMDGVRFIRSVCDGVPLSRWPRQEQRVEEFTKTCSDFLCCPLFEHSVEVVFPRSPCL